MQFSRDDMLHPERFRFFNCNTREYRFFQSMEYSHPRKYQLRIDTERRNPSHIRVEATLIGVGLDERYFDLKLVVKYHESREVCGDVEVAAYTDGIMHIKYRVAS